MAASAAPIAEAIGAALCWAAGLSLIARRQRLIPWAEAAEPPSASSPSADPLKAATVSESPTWSPAAFRVGVLVYLAGHALSVASALELDADDPSVAPLRAVALSAAMPLCWMIQVVLERQLPSCLQTASYWGCFVGAALLQLGAAWPLEGPGAGLHSLRRLEGLGDYPVAALAAYLVACLLCLFAGMGTMLRSLPSGLAENVQMQGSSALSTSCLALSFALLCGAAAVAAELALAIGAEAALDHDEAQYGVFALLLGICLALLVVRCSWECMHSLAVPLADFAPLVFSSCATFRVVQAQVLFRDVSWLPNLQEGYDGLPSVGLCAAGGASLLLVNVSLSYKLVTSRSQGGAHDDYKALSTRAPDANQLQDARIAKVDKSEKSRAAKARRAREEAQLQEPPGPSVCMSSILQSDTFKKGWQWVGVIICAVSYYAGITRALFLITPPEVLATAPAVERSNLQLIVYLCTVGMPLASLMVVIFSLIIPLFKFATTFLVMHPPSWVTREQHAKFCQLLCAMSPYQMSDIFLVMLILAYLNTGFSAGGHGSGYESNLCSGFKSFFVYCFVSICVAQILEIEHAEALEEAPDLAAKAGFDDQEAFDEKHDRPGIYAVVRKAAVVPTVHMTGTAEIHTSLKAGDLVEVLEVVLNEGERRLRGRIANPPGWISLLDLDDGHRWAERQEGRPYMEESLARLMFFIVLWMISMFSLLELPTPPMSLQARSGGVIVYRQEPTLGQLFDALWQQSQAFSGLMVAVLIVTPVLFIVVALARILLFRHHLDPIWARRLWIAEQILKPWVMGDVAAVSITSLFLSIQEPSTDFVFLCVRLATPPFGFLVCLGQGMACWGLRWCTPPLRPATAASATTQVEVKDAAQGTPPGSSLLSAFSAAWVSFQTQCAGLGGPSACRQSFWLGNLVWREIAVWLFWFTVFWQLGPHEPPSVHSLQDMNSVLVQEVPRINLLLMENIPPAIGDCQELMENRQKSKKQMDDDDCKDVPMKPIKVSALGLSARVLFIDGLASLRIVELKVLPESHVNVREQRNDPGFAQGQRWAISIKGQFSDLKIWARATKGGTDWVNGYICCNNPYHLALQLSVYCSDRQGFLGNVTVDDFHIDPVSLNTRWGDQQPANAVHSSFQIEMGGSEDLVHEAIKTHLEAIIVQKTGGAAPVKPGLPTVALTDILNKILGFNGGAHCPKFG